MFSPAVPGPPAWAVTAVAIVTVGWFFFFFDLDFVTAGGIGADETRTGIVGFSTAAVAPMGFSTEAGTATVGTAIAVAAAGISIVFVAADVIASGATVGVGAGAETTANSAATAAAAGASTTDAVVVDFGGRETGVTLVSARAGVVVSVDILKGRVGGKSNRKENRVVPLKSKVLDDVKSQRSTKEATKQFKKSFRLSYRIKIEM